MEITVQCLLVPACSMQIYGRLAYHGRWDLEKARKSASCANKAGVRYIIDYDSSLMV